MVQRMFSAHHVNGEMYYFKWDQATPLYGVVKYRTGMGSTGSVMHACVQAIRA